MKADLELRERLGEALKIDASRFKYSANLEDVTKDAKPKNYLGFMDADGNGFGDMLSKLGDKRRKVK